MESAPEHTERLNIAARVRQNVIPTAIAAALMMYFGFNVLLEPEGADLFHKAGLVFYHTLRIGGIAMAVLAVSSLSGHCHILIVDAVVSVAIGALFALTGVAMLIDGGGMLQTVLNVLFGSMFITAGVRNGRDYFMLAPTCR